MKEEEKINGDAGQDPDEVPDKVEIDLVEGKPSKFKYQNYILNHHLFISA